MLFLLFVLVVNVKSLQCPAPEDRRTIHNSGELCYFYNTYGCCFPETINGSNTSCCYKYSLDGTMKCYGWYKYNFTLDIDHPITIFGVALLLFSLTVIILVKSFEKKVDQKDLV